MSNNFRTGNIDTRDLFADDAPSHEDSLSPAENQTESTASSPAPTNSAAAPVRGKQVILEELDSLRYVLNEGPEFQGDIPLLEDVEQDPKGNADSCDMGATADINVPILTETCTGEPDPAEPDPAEPDPAEPVQPQAESTEALLEQLVDEVVAQYLPELEQQLKIRLLEALGHSISQGDTPDTHIASETPSNLENCIDET